MRPLKIIVLAAALVLAVSTVASHAMRRQNQALARAAALTGGDPARGPALAIQYGCAGCHEIRGVRGPGGRVGPPLTSVAERVYLGGVATNTPENLVHWIVNPKGFSPKTAMPITGISEPEARHVAAYLLGLR
jgi:cytochrome c2